MATRKNKTTKNNEACYISVLAQIINSVSSSSSLRTLLDSSSSSSSKNSSKNTKKPVSYFLNVFVSLCRKPKFWAFSLFLLSFLGMLKLSLSLCPFAPLHKYPSRENQLESSDSDGSPKSHLGFAYAQSNSTKVEILKAMGQSLATISKPEGVSNNGHDSDGEEEFWKQPDGLGYKPCLGFSGKYRRESNRILRDRRKYLMVVVSGGMNQQRNQIVDAVVIARILGAALVVPILEVNIIWGDESEFCDIFDLEHFKRVLANDVRVLLSLPSEHVKTKPSEASKMPLHASPQWIRSHYLKRFNRGGVLLLTALDSKLSKDLPSDLQKLRCKVAFEALRFVPRVLELGNKLAERMRSKGPYLALHLRLEKDVWVRTGCLSGLSPRYDEIVKNERIKRPELLTAKSNMKSHERKLAGLCPLNAKEVSRLLRALGAPRNARIYWAGGDPLGGKEALAPLTREFPHFYNKHDLASPGELEPFAERASLMAAIDYIVCEQSDVFMASHGGNMGRAIQGHRAYAGHRKYITPNKRHMLPYIMNTTMAEAEFDEIVMSLHRNSLGQPELRTTKAGRDVTKYPVPECMCNDSTTRN